MMMILFRNTTKSGKKIKKLFNPKENIYYSCIAAIGIDSVINYQKKTILKSILNSVNLDSRTIKALTYLMMN